MQTDNRQATIDLVSTIDYLIRQAQVKDEVKQRAMDILDFYVIGPALIKDPDFFTGRSFGRPCGFAADAEWAPFLLHILQTGLNLLKAEQEILPTAKGLNNMEGIPTHQELTDRFVTALAGFYMEKHSDYRIMRSKLVNAIVNGVSHEESSDKTV